jgi:hypothetical protein
MQTGMRNLNTSRDPAKPDLSFKPVHPAFARTTFTSYQSIY